MINNIKIKTKIHPKCPVCNSVGVLLYSNLTDRIFDIPGIWEMKKCPQKSCETIWLDPTPLESELHKLYKNYYTHQAPPEETPLIKVARSTLLTRIRDSYISAKYQYRPTSNLIAERLLGFVAYIHPAWRDTQSADLFYLEAKEDGRLLDVGCGSGTTMKIMSQRGWVATGIDFDEKAIRNARRKGLDARLGELSAQGFTDKTFDAIVMGHVIEHLPNPLDALTECYRILKKDGVLVITTPNSASRGSKYYKEDWRGLETPRHLQVFTTKSLKKLASSVGFESVRAFTTMQSDLYIWRASRDLHKKNQHNMTAPVDSYTRIILHLLNFIVGWVNIFSPSRSEVAVIICKK